MTYICLRKIYHSTEEKSYGVGDEIELEENIAEILLKRKAIKPKESELESTLEMEVDNGSNNWSN